MKILSKWFPKRKPKVINITINNLVGTLNVVGKDSTDEVRRKVIEALLDAVNDGIKLTD